MPATLLDLSLKNWFANLAHHDPRDTKGILEGISIVLALLAARSDPGPEPTLTADQRTRAKAWRRALRSALDDIDGGES